MFDAIGLVNDLLDAVQPTHPDLPGKIIPDYSRCGEHFFKVVAFAKSVDALDQLGQSLEYLATYGQAGGNVTRCKLYTDFARHSFGFTVERFQPETGWKPWMSGGLIYEGPDQPLDGSAPALCVSLHKRSAKSPHSWTTHT